MSSLTPDELIISHSNSASGSGDKGKLPPNSTSRWISSWHFIMASVCYSVSYSGYNTYGTDDKPCLFQYIILIILVGLPIFYTQTFLGQYCQMGMLNFRNVMPMARGIMYSFMMCVILKTIRYGYDITDVLLYFLMSFQNTLPWMVCPKNYEKLCNSTNTTNDYPHSAYVFWKYIYLGNPTLDIDQVTFTITSFFLTVGTVLQWLFVFVMAMVAYSEHRKVTRALMYCHFFILSLLVVAMHICTTMNGHIFRLLVFQIDDLLNPNSWLLSIRSIICDLCLADLHNMYAGAHLSPTAPSATLSAGCVFSITFMNALASYLTCICHFTIKDKHGMDISITDPHNLGYAAGNILIVIPQGISYLTLPQWWSALFFVSCLCTMISNQILHLTSIIMTITDMYPDVSKYSSYLLGGCCLFGSVVGVLFHSNTMYVITRYALEESLSTLMVVCVCIWAIMVYWLYGVSRLSDDIQFLMGVQPTRFWKIHWHVIPAVFAVMVAFYYVTVYRNMDPSFILTNICMLMLLIAPLILFFVVELFTNIKKKNMLGTFQPHARWGPPDPEERLYRKYFNPRTETKYQAHKLICHHKCLLTSATLKSIVQKENALRAEYFKDNESL